MANGIRTGDPRGFNKGRSSKSRVASRVQQIPEEGRKTYRPKRCENNNKDKDNSPKTLNDKNPQTSSQKFQQHTPEEGRRTYRPKRCGNNNEDEDNSPKALNDKNYQASSQKFWKLSLKYLDEWRLRNKESFDSWECQRLLVQYIGRATSDILKP